MKKYNVHNLYVVEIKNNNDDIHYFICKYNKLSDTYIEIFTKEKIKISYNVSVEPLSSYYTPTKSKQPLLLDKKELLQEYITINESVSSQLNNINSEENTILEQATLNFFPKEGIWYGTCFDRPKDLDMDNLPCHLYDDLWLAKMFQKNQKLFHIGINKILKFVTTSPLFQEQKHAYEQQIVKWQIEWMRSGGEHWIIDDNYGGDFVFLTSVCDLGFRKGVVDTLAEIGLSIPAIEEGIEKNTNLWRDALMIKAFKNQYEPINFSCTVLISNANNDSEEETKSLVQTSQEFQDNWLKMRKYEYYQEHQDSVDKYGTVEPEMMLSNQEVAKLQDYLTQKHNERMAQIAQYQQEKSKVLKRGLNNT